MKIYGRRSAIGKNFKTMSDVKINSQWCNNKGISEEKIVKSTMYRYIVCTEFNLSFKTPHLDT